LSLLVERRDLLDAFRRGEQSALADVYRHYAPELAAFLRRGFTFSARNSQFRFRGYESPFDLDNSLQETFSRAFKHSARLNYDGLHPYKPYLFTIARNFVLEEFRHREVAMSQYVYSCDLESSGATASGDANVHDSNSLCGEQEYLRDELRRLYEAFMERLNDRDRCFFRYRFEEQRTQIDAGSRVGMSHMQARTLEKKLRKGFLEFMRSHGYLDGYGLAQAAKAT
jgi:RNA polymerase sigma factor (sigma-70 family)